MAAPTLDEIVKTALTARRITPTPRLVSQVVAAGNGKTGDGLIDALDDAINAIVRRRRQRWLTLVELINGGAIYGLTVATARAAGWTWPQALGAAILMGALVGIHALIVGLRR